jgi:hypothetical protein
MQIDLLNDQGQSTSKVEAPDTVFARDYRRDARLPARAMKGVRKPESGAPGPPLGVAPRPASASLSPIAVPWPAGISKQPIAGERQGHQEGTGRNR